MTVAGAPQQRLDDRYGRTSGARRRGRRAGTVAAAAGGAALLAWLVWTGVGGAAADPVDVRTDGFSVQSGSAVSVDWRVSGASDTPLACTIEAQAADRGIVGLVEVAVPAAAGSGERGGTTVVRTQREAVTGLISSCRRA